MYFFLLTYGYKNAYKQNKTFTNKQIVLFLDTLPRYEIIFLWVYVHNLSFLKDSCLLIILTSNLP